MPTVVKKKPGDSEDKMIMAFRRKVLAEDLINKFKTREFYQKPSKIKYEKRKLLKSMKKRWS